MECSPPEEDLFCVFVIWFTTRTPHFSLSLKLPSLICKPLTTLILSSYHLFPIAHLSSRILLPPSLSLALLLTTTPLTTASTPSRWSTFMNPNTAINTSRMRDHAQSTLISGGSDTPHIADIIGTCRNEQGAIVSKGGCLFSVLSTGVSMGLAVVSLVFTYCIASSILDYYNSNLHLNININITINRNLIICGNWVIFSRQRLTENISPASIPLPNLLGRSIRS